MNEQSMPYEDVASQLALEQLLRLCFQKTGAKTYKQVRAQGSYQRAIEYGRSKGYFDKYLNVTASGRALINLTLNKSEVAA